MYITLSSVDPFFRDVCPRPNPCPTNVTQKFMVCAGISMGKARIKKCWMLIKIKKYLVSFKTTSK